MQYLTTGVFTFIALAAAGYAHYRLPVHTAKGVPRWFTHLMLISVGLAFGWAMATVYFEAEGLMQLMIFLYAFGAVHIPAGFILFIKQRRRRDEDRHNSLRTKEQ